MFPYVPCCRCERTAWYSTFTWIICTLVARVAVTVRFVPFLLFSNPDPISYNTYYPSIYAVALGNIPSVVGLVIIAVVEFAFGIALTVHAVKSPGNTWPVASKEPLVPGAHPFCHNRTCVT